MKHSATLTSVFSLVCVLMPVVSAAQQRPNIVLIMVDDVSWEAFGCYGGEDYRTPHLDAMAADGIRFQHCYSTPICTTSRVMIMTGKYNFRNYTHFGYLDPTQKTFGHLFQEAGYNTAIAGKWQLNGLSNRRVFPDNQDQARPQQLGFDEYCLWQLTKQKAETDGGERFWSPPLEKNGEMLTIEQNADLYGPDIMCEFIKDFMDRHQDEPFFVYYPMLLVHDPFVPTPDSIGDGARDHSANRAPRGREAKKENFVAMVEYTDTIVGRLTEHLDELGQLENTLILFTADNGTNRSIESQWNGRTIKGGKGGLTDMGTHVPLIAYWKDHIEPAVVDDLVDFTDIYPTIAEAAGIDLDEDDPSDGTSFFPRLLGQPGLPREWTVCYYQPYWGQPPGLFARTPDYKLYTDGRFYEVPRDLDEANDLGEANQNPEASHVRTLLQALLDQCPPLPAGKGNVEASVERPIYPAWPTFRWDD